MKKRILFILLIAGLRAEAQQTYFTPGVPPGSASIALSDRWLTGDSITSKFFIGVAGSQFWLLYTAAQSNLRFLQKADSTHYITPFYFNNRLDTLFAHNFGNGLMNYSGVIGIGGLLTQLTDLDINSGRLAIKGNNIGGTNWNNVTFQPFQFDIQFYDPTASPFNNSNFHLEQGNTYLESGNINGNIGIELLSNGIGTLFDQINNKGFVYQADYSAKQLLDTLSIPSMKAVKLYIGAATSGFAPSGGGTLTNPIVGGIGIKPFSWNNTARDTVNVDTTKIPLTITPNQFNGTDIDRIQDAVNLAASTSHVVHIPSYNKRDGSAIWLIDTAILLPANITVYIDNSTIKLSNQSRDNVFRSNNVGVGITSPTNTSNIRIIGTGVATIQGADNPRATGDAGKTLTLTSTGGNFSYGTDASDSTKKQTGDWRDHAIILALCNSFEVSNLTMHHTHGYSLDFERSQHGIIKNITLDNDRTSTYAGTSQLVLNRDGIDVIFGGQYINIDNVTGRSGDDAIALEMGSALSPLAGSLNSSVVTGYIFNPTTDTIHDINISNVNAYSFTSITRLLAVDSLRMYNINLNNITDASNATDVDNAVGGVVIIGDNNVIYGGPTPFGGISRININGLKCFRKTNAIQLYGSLSESTINNAVKLNSGHNLINYVIGTIGMRNVTLSNSWDQSAIYYSQELKGVSDYQAIKTNIADSTFRLTDRTGRGLEYLPSTSYTFPNPTSIPSKAFNDLRYQPLENQRVSTTNAVSFAGVTSTNSIVSNMAASTNRFFFQVAGVNRWVNVINNAETGSNVGSDFQLLRRADDGTNLGTALTIVRSTGIPSFPAITTTGVAHFVGGALSSSLLATADISANAVTYAKMQAGTANKLFGTGSGTAFEEITLGSGFIFSGTTLNYSASNKSHTIFTPTTGTTVTLVNNQTNIINPSGALVALTIALPSSPSNNDKVEITFTQAVTTIGYSGGTVVGGPTTIAATGQYYLTYDSTSTSWY